jgi:hypothetical protein
MSTMCIGGMDGLAGCADEGDEDGRVWWPESVLVSGVPGGEGLRLFT